MPRTPAAALAWAKDEAATGRIHSSWSGLCEALINWMYDYGAFPTALAAGSASGTLRTDYGNAPVGANLYWSGVWVDGIECGHIASVIEHAPDPLLIMASSAGSNLGRNIRTIRLSEYQRTFGHPLRGWSMRHGTQTPAGTTSAGNGGTEEIDMAEEASVQEAIRIGNVNFVLLNKIIANQADDADDASVKEAIRIANVNYSILTKLQSQPSAVIDATKLAAALTAAGLKVTIDAKAIAAAVDASLKDDFLAIPGAVNADAAKRLSS